MTGTDFASALAYVAAGVATIMAVMVSWRERRRPGGVLLALGLLVFAAREIFGALARDAIFKTQADHWLRMRLTAQALLPSVWIAFSVSFARTNFEAFRKRWRLAVAGALVLPLLLLAWRFDKILATQSVIVLPSWLISVDGAGVALHALYLLGSVLVLMNVESTLRASSGTARWQIKFLLLGTGVAFGVEMFLSSQVLLDSWIRTTLFPLGSAAVIVLCALIGATLVRRRDSPASVYTTGTQLFGSVSLLAVGIYLLVVAGFVDAIRAFAGNELAPFVTFVLGLLALAFVLLSSELRQRTRILLNRLLGRPSYDYRLVWDSFTRNTSSLMEIEPLCAGITKTAAETFGCSAASVWLKKPGERRMVLGGSTALSEERAKAILADFEDGRSFVDLMADKLTKAVDLSSGKLSERQRELLRRMEARYAVALVAGSQEPIGWLTLNEPLTGARFGFEDFSLFKTLGDQSAATVANRRLTEELARAKELETFQTLSTFFVHDLKNLASRLSLAMQNLPAHFDKPAFRKDLLDTMSKSLVKIESMTSRLSAVSKGLSIERADCDVNLLVSETLRGLKSSVPATVTESFSELPPVGLDREQIQKVLTNLVLNALDAAGESGTIEVSTRRENGWVLVSVQDDGCGMSEEFMSSQLFKPFQTTKKQGLGIGLFHSKKIVEAHGGRIEVESVRGKGSTFKVLLPATQS